MGSSKSRRLRFGLFVFGWLLLLELLLRLPPVQSRLEIYAHTPVWYAPYVEQRIELIRSNPDADIWFIGASSTALDINPAIIDPILVKQTGKPHKSLNVGLFGMLFVDHLENHIVHAFLPVGKPKIMVFGTFPTLFAFSTQINDGNSGDYYLMRDRSQELDSVLYNNLALFRFIHTFRYIIAESPTDRSSPTPTGFMPNPAAMVDMSIPQWNVSTNNQLEKNLGLIKHMRDTLQQHDIQLMFLNLPVYDPEREFHPGGSSNYEAYINRLTAFLAEENIPFLNAWDTWQERNGNMLPAEYFMDYHHLDEAGANSLSPVIGELLAGQID